MFKTFLVKRKIEKGTRRERGEGQMEEKRDRDRGGGRGERREEGREDTRARSHLLKRVRTSHSSFFFFNFFKGYRSIPFYIYSELILVI